MEIVLKLDKDSPPTPPHRASNWDYIWWQGCNSLVKVYVKTYNLHFKSKYRTPLSYLEFMCTKEVTPCDGSKVVGGVYVDQRDFWRHLTVTHFNLELVHKFCIQIKFIENFPQHYLCYSATLNFKTDSIPTLMSPVWPPDCSVFSVHIILFTASSLHYYLTCYTILEKVDRLKWILNSPRKIRTFKMLGLVYMLHK